MKSFDFGSSERKWQKQWDKEKLFELKSSSFSSPRSKNRYVLVMFPYPSGEGLHVGHVESYTAADIFTRYLRLKGFNVLHPMGWDAFGLPAENYAIKHKTHPSLVVEKNIATFKKQLKSLGFSYDWTREINTTDPDYYKWTQWIFLRLFEDGLAYEKEVPVNWCPSCKTVLSDEEAESGVCDRCGSKIERKNLKQWMLKITAYADRLLKDLDLVDWPQRVKTMQRNWIGKSEGARVQFEISGKPFVVEVFTTRPDTIFGATYLVLAPEHPLIAQLGLNIKNWREVSDYVKNSKNRSDQERISEAKEKTGVTLEGVLAVNPANGKKILVWTADYVLPHYGTGAIMAVPAHDQRDRDFAKKFGLPIIPVISPDGKITVDEEAYEGDGILVNSGRFDGRKNIQAAPLIIDFVKGKRAVQFKLRDWIFSRQRYWGEPIPLVFCEACKKQVENSKFKIKNSKLTRGELLNPGWVPVPEKELPLKLPKVKNYKPTGTLASPLVAVTDWVNARCPRCGGLAKRETDTMPQWAGSCWYYLRYLDPKNQKSIASSKKEKAFMPVDMYIGGAEHAVLHLLYARFWHKFLYDKKVVKDPEPFKRLVNQGLILGSDGEKMSKSRGNVVNPDDIVKDFGADALRMYEMFMGPLEDSKLWNAQGIIGIPRFLNRVWAFYWERISDKKASKKPAVSGRTDFERVFHRSIKKITDDIEVLHFNTAISALMILLKEMESFSRISRKQTEEFVVLLSPFAPFICESIWRDVLKNKKSVLLAKWPAYSARLAALRTAEVAVQINGKTRGTVTIARQLSKEEILKIIGTDKKLGVYIKNKEIKRVVFVPDKIINILI